MLRRGVLTTIVIALAVPAAADAACPAQSARQQAALAGVILTGVVESGPLSPARIRVERWEKGRGPAVVEVETGVHEDYTLGEGITPQPGERWRIFGDREGGTIVTGVCHGSRRLGAAPPAPRLLGTALARSTFAGRPLHGALPRLAVRAGRLRLPAGLADARVLGASPGVRATARGLRVPSRARRLGRLVVDTGAGFFAARLVRPR